MLRSSRMDQSSSPGLVGQSLIEGVAHDLVASSDTIEAVREVDGIADHAHVRTAQGPEREHLEVTQCYRDVHTGGRVTVRDAPAKESVRPRGE